MGYLDNSSITVDAILTLKGRELLSKGDGSFNIVQFALGDDEVDYNLWNPEHPLGTDYYGTLIENMPITEAIPDETQALRYKLITLPKQSNYVPIVSVGNTSLTLRLEARSHNVYNGKQKVILSTNMVFVRIDDQGDAIPISERVRLKYNKSE